MVEKVPTIAAGVPDGGTTGQVLAKASNTDSDVVWVPASGIATPANPGDNGKALVASGGHVLLANSRSRRWRSTYWRHC